MKECNKPYTTEHVLNLDVDDLATIPDFFLAVRTLEDPSTGATVATPVRVPGARVMPTGNLANVIALVSNNPALNIPEGQVRAGYIDVQPGGNVMRYADASNRAMFLMIGEYTNGKMLVQSTGFLNIPSGHQYITGMQYYTSDNGEPSTNSASEQKLFIPISDTVLMVNGDF